MGVGSTEPKDAESSALPSARRTNRVSMSEYDSWAAVYDAWGGSMPDDVAHYVRLAREADGPIVAHSANSILTPTAYSQLK